MRRQRSGSTPHDAVAIDRGPQRRPSFLLALGRQRPRLGRSARSARNRTANLLAQPAIRLFTPARTPTLQAKAIGSAPSLHRPRHPRRGQIPIAPAAPSVPNTPRFPALALFGRRPPERVDDLCIPASENLHNNGSDAPHSINSSAVASNVGGTLMPSVLAVLRLITSSNLTGCTTGSSAGFAPLRILPTYRPPLR